MKVSLGKSENNEKYVYIQYTIYNMCCGMMVCYIIYICLNL